MSPESFSNETFASDDHHECLDCPKTFQRKEYLRRQVRTFHLKLTSSICKICTKNFQTLKRNLHSHQPKRISKMQHLSEKIPYQIKHAK